MPMIPNSSWTADDWFGFTFGLLACAALVWTGWNVYIYKMCPPEDSCNCKGRCKCKDSSSDPDENIEM